MDCRGSRDLVINGLNGYVISLKGTKGYAEAIYKLYASDELRKTFGKKSLDLVKKIFS
ncbi:MAG: glycosyltransferase family 4 protein [Clostridiales bacterium]|nr:glycosyltransferase family 4 protein [Clostridiales bacterium]